MTDTLYVYAAESQPAGDYDAELTVKIDGVQVGADGVTTVYGTGTEMFYFYGDFGAGPHSIEMPFAPVDHGQILYVESIVYDGHVYSGEYATNTAQSANAFYPAGMDNDPVAAELYSPGKLTFTGVTGSTTHGEFISGTTISDQLTGTTGDDVIIGQTGNDQIVGNYGNDIINGGPGNDILTGGSGRDYFLERPGDGNDTEHFEAGANGDVMNLAGYGFTGFTDVQAHMTQLSGGGTLLSLPNGETITFLGDGTEPNSSVIPGNFVADNFRFNISDPPPSSSPSGLSSLTVHVSEDAWNGNAQFLVLVDGKQIGGTQTATASHALGQTQDITLNGDFGTGLHTVSVQFINDAYGGSASTDRNLYVSGITMDGITYAGSTASDNAAGGHQADDPTAAVMHINGTATFHNVAAPPNSTLVLHVSEDVYQGNAQFKVTVDGVQVGGVQTVTALHNAGQVQDITLTGDFGAQGPGKIDFTFLNDTWGGTSATDRNLYIESLDINDIHFQGNTATNNTSGGHQDDDPTGAVMHINGTAEFNINHTAPVEIMG